jgi:uncharacterized protein (TIGR03382 family)
VRPDSCDADVVVHRAWLVIALAVALSVPSVARAHGGPPVVETLSFDPSDPMHLYAGTNFGSIVSHDGGATWGWICPAATELQTMIEDPLVLVTHEGSLLLGDRTGLWRADGGGCDWSSVLAAAGATSVGALARGGPGVLLAGTSAEDLPNTLARSTTDGVSWDAVLGPTDGVWYESIVTAPSDPQRIYAVANRPPLRAEPWEAATWRSDDGGDHWTSAPFTLLAHEWRLFLLAVDPTHPDRILAHTQNVYPMEHERVVLSEDGGATWTDVLTLRQVLGGAWAPDGSSAYLAGPLDGLWRSDDGARTFAGVRTSLFLRCVVATSDAVWVCADDFTAGFAIGRSTDRGASFGTIARLSSIVGLASCPSGTALADACAGEAAVLESVLAAAPTTVPDAGIDAGAGELDAGSDAAIAPPAPASCHCAAGAGTTSAIPFAGLVLVIVSARRRRSRAGAPRRTWHPGQARSRR